MDLIFDQGTQESPRGHAIVYFRSGTRVLATYLVVLPMQVDFSKYVPPVLAAQVKDVGLQELSAFAMPPAPEETPGGLPHLEALARLRQDDLLFAGEIPGGDFLEGAQRVHDAVLAYGRLCARSRATTEETQPTGGPPLSDLGVDEVMYSFMGERERLGELTELVRKLQFASEVKDTDLVQETMRKMRSLAPHLPEDYQMQRLIMTLERSLERGLMLAQLYVQRCYKLRDHDHAGLREVDDAIRGMESAGQ